MALYNFPNIVRLVREKNIKLHLSTCKVVVTLAGRMVLVSPTFGDGLWGSFREQEGDLFGRFSPNKHFFELIQKDRQKAEYIISELVNVEKNGLSAVKSIGLLTGNCCICGRTLTKEESIEDGIGPICSGKVGGMW